MDQAASIWTPHLKPGEHIVWSASVVEDRYLAEVSRRRKLGLAIMVAAVLAAILLGLGFASSFEQPTGDSFYLIPNLNLTGYFMAPVYVALILTCIFIAIAQVVRFNLPRPAATGFAVTSARLLAADASGAIVDQIDSAGITDVRLVAPGLVVHRQSDGVDLRPFSIAYIERPLEAKAIIEETFLEQANEQAD